MVGTLTSRLSRFHLHFECNLGNELFVELDEFFGDLYFASPRTLEFKFEFEYEPVSHSSSHVFCDWDLPALETLRLCNIIPEFRPRTLEGLMNCSLIFLEVHVTFSWALPTHQQRTHRQYIDVPKHPTLGLGPEASQFWRAIKMQNMTSWTFECQIHRMDCALQ